MTAAAGAAPIPATVMILARNAADTLPAALGSVADFAEVVVSDGRSTDDTVAIAIDHGAVVIRQDDGLLDADGRLRDYAAARHQVVQVATQPWIFHLDADELATPALAEAIRDIATLDEGVAGYRCGARHVVGESVVRSAANYPMRFLRVFRRDAVVGYAGPIDERPEFAAGATVGAIDEHFLIPMPRLSTVVRKWARYQRIIAGNARSSTLGRWWHDELPERWRSAKWLAWRTWKSHRHEPEPRMPLRYDVARVGFQLAGAVSSGVGAAVGRRRRS